MPDVLAREGIHPETPRVPYTPGWDLVGIVDLIGEGAYGFELGQTVAAMPISGCYAQYVCLPQRKFVPVPTGLDPAEAVAVVLSYISAYQMLHRSAKVKPGQRVLIHGASGGAGTAFLQLGRLVGVEIYGTCSAQAAEVVRGLGATAIDYRNSDFVQEIHRLIGDGVVADATETRVVPPRPAHTVRPTAAEEDQAPDRRTVASLSGAARTRITRRRRRDR